MVDIHSHILPFLDDGAASLEESITMAEIAARNGINHIVASSHGNYYTYTLSEYKEQFEKLQRVLKDREIPVKLYSGMEIFVDGEVVSLLEEGKLLPINGTNYLLIEFPFDDTIFNVQKRISELQEKGYRIILAHPERYSFLQKDPEFAYYLEETGCVLQVNQGSILGDFGAGARRLAMQMLENGIVGVIATDTHDVEHRTPSIRRLLSFMKNYNFQEEIHLWLSENPSRILKGYPVIRMNADREEE